MIHKTGKLLFKNRALVAVPFFIALVWQARPQNHIILPIVLFVIGLGIRIWAAGYIGKTARGQEFRSRFRITGGPYRFLRHPLYIGNLFLVVGTILLFNPLFWLAVIIIALFLIEYGFFICAEEKYLKDLPNQPEKFSLRRLKHEFSTWIVVGAVYIVYVVKVVLLNPKS